MNAEDINIIQLSWNRLMGKEDATISRFYELLFSQQPEYKPMFTQSEETLRLKFITMLNLIVNGLEHLDLLETHLIDLGKKHIHLNITLNDYEIVAKILIQAIDEVSGDSLTEAEKKAWMEGLMLVSAIMDKESRQSSDPKRSCGS